jgi:hypothetical protein
VLSNIKVYAPLDFSGIPGYSNENPTWWVECLPRFCGDTHLVAHHVAFFMDYIFELNVEHEDVEMRMFPHSLLEIEKYWFRGFGKGEITSFLNSVINILNSRQGFGKSYSPSNF